MKLWSCAITALALILALVLPVTSFATALTADRITEKQVLGVKAYPVAASTKIYAGALVALNSSGYAVPAADTAGYKVVGIASAQADNASGANGAINVLAEAPVIARLNATSITQAMVGKAMYVVDDNTVDDTFGTNGIFAGILIEYISTTSGRFLISPVAVTPSDLVVVQEVSFTETTGAGTYTGAVTVPAGATVLDVIWRNTALWTASTTATMKAGTAADDDMFFTNVDVKTAPIIDVNGAGGLSSFKNDTGSGVAGGLTTYCSSACTVSFVVTTVGATGAAGRSRGVVIYVRPSPAGASKA